MSERDEIEADLEAQGLDDETTYEQVAATFNLYKTMRPPDEFGPPPSPAQGPDWRYVPEAGEESLFADTSDMFFPPD